MGGALPRDRGAQHHQGRRTGSGAAHRQDGVVPQLPRHDGRLARRRARDLVRRIARRIRSVATPVCVTGAPCGCGLGHGCCFTTRSREAGRTPTRPISSSRRRARGSRRVPHASTVRLTSTGRLPVPWTSRIASGGRQPADGWIAESLGVLVAAPRPRLTCIGGRTTRASARLLGHAAGATGGNIWASAREACDAHHNPGDGALPDFAMIRELASRAGSAPR